jgi:diguanylate cyclase (GGDEF)-like protein
MDDPHLFSRLGNWLGGHLRRYAFGLRLALALVVSMALLMGASQIFFTEAISQQLVDQGARFYATEGVAIEKAFRGGDTPADKFDDALDLVDSMGDRPEVVSAALFDADSREVVLPRDATRSDSKRQGKRDPNPQFQAVFDEGRAYSGPEVEAGEHGAHFEFIVPLQLGGQAYALEVDQDGAGMRAQVATLRNKTMVFSTVALLVAVVLFYFVGGRSLARRHGKAMKGATRDPLTDLGNHSMFQEELDRAVAFASRYREPLTLALIDLDDFKFINDRHGHRRGDEVLARTAQVLESGRAEDRAFRIGGDEFALLMPGSDSARALTAVERLLAAARSDSDATSFSAGIAVVAPGIHDNPAALWEQADAALYEGKRIGGTRVVVFDEVAEQISVVTPEKVHALRSLLAEPRLETAFQPIWKLQERVVLGFEALSRPWGGYGFDSPAEAFAIAEKIGRAHELDAICRVAALDGASELPGEALLFLNVHPQSLTHNSLDGDRLVRAVKAVGFDPERVVLEITERSEARLDQVIAEARRLSGFGFGLALDDVGAGNSGLEMLRDLPVDYVKIDNSVIVAAVDDPQAQAVLVAIIAYARRAKAFVIAEGIESDEILAFIENAHHLDVLKDPVIDGAQGFLLGCPDPDLSQTPIPLRRARAA